MDQWLIVIPLWVLSICGLVVAYRSWIEKQIERNMQVTQLNLQNVERALRLERDATDSWRSRAQACEKQMALYDAAIAQAKLNAMNAEKKD